MRHGYFFSLILILNLVTVLLPTPAQCQTSTGYTTPDDITDLLEYRLPDWSYRLWDADFNLNGQSQESRQSGSFEGKTIFPLK